MSLAAQLSRLSITICKMGIRIVPPTSDCWEAMHGEDLVGFWICKFLILYSYSYSCKSSRTGSEGPSWVQIFRAHEAQSVFPICATYKHIGNNLHPVPYLPWHFSNGGSSSSVSLTRAHITHGLSTCHVIPGTAKREEETVLSLDDWWPGIIILQLPGHSAPIISRELSFIFSMLKAHASTVVRNLMAAYIWGDRIPFLVPWTGCYCCRKEVPEVTIPLWLKCGQRNHLMQSRLWKGVCRLKYRDCHSQLAG